MNRLAIAIVALLVGLAAPARAWCEASCLAPAPAHAHCPAHDTSDKPTLTAANGDCPVLDSARPNTVAREQAGSSAELTVREVAPTHLASTHRAPQHLCTSAPPHLINSPLRI